MALIVAAFTSFVLVVSLIVLLIYLVHAEESTLEASFTKWITIKVRLKSPKSIQRPGSTRRRAIKKRQRQPLWLAVAELEQTR